MTGIFCPEPGNQMQDQSEALVRQAVEFCQQLHYLDALPLFRQAAEAGHPQALGALGWYYENGYYVARDIARAADYYRQAADRGDGLAAGRLGMLYDSVTADFPTDDQEAFRLYSLALSRNAATGPILNNLAVLCMDGRGTEPDYRTAEKLLHQAKSLGHPLAGCNLEVLHQRLDRLGQARPLCPRCGAPAVPVFRQKQGGSIPMVCKTCGQLFRLK